MEMNKVALFFFLLLFVKVGFANHFVLNNQVASPANNTIRIAIQWASSPKEIKELNNQLKQSTKLNPSSLYVLERVGKINVDIPKNMEYFRILVWSKGAEKIPNFLTNWVDVIPNKIYMLNKDQLTPLILISGIGC